MTEITLVAKQRLEEIVAFRGVNAHVEATETEEGIELAIAGSPATPQLIGHHGETLRAIEYVLNPMMKRTDGESPRVNVDVAGYRQARRESLEELAREVAERVKSSGDEEELKPMNAAERRIVHMALRDIPEVETESRGDDRDRRIVVKPAE